MKPANFPERKRQRQLRALARLKASTAGKPWKGVEPRSNDAEFVSLHRATSEGSARDIRTKKNRSDRGRFTRAA
jgi:hypothetical protein